MCVCASTGSQCLLSAQASWLRQVRVTELSAAREFAFFAFFVCVCVCVYYKILLVSYKGCKFRFISYFRIFFSTRICLEHSLQCALSSVL